MTIFERITDYIIKSNYYSKPSYEQLKNCRLVAHRGGDFNNKPGHYENTLAVMERSYDAGVWGIEFDVRWTKDLVPVIAHDTNLKRVYGLPHKISKCSFKELRSVCPLIPTLEEVVFFYGKRMHFMIEIKSETYPWLFRQNSILSDILSDLEPYKDYHMLSTEPEFLKYIMFPPQDSFIAVGDVNTICMSNYAYKNNFAGFAGWYALISNERIIKHSQANQKVGTGWITSKQSLYREINRGAYWLFSNDAIKLQRLINEELKWR